MLLTPYFWVALSARSETKRYCSFSRTSSRVKPALFDRLPVVVSLHRAADTGSPERGVAGDALGQLGRADDVGDREPAAGAQHARSLREDRWLVGREVDHAVGDHDVDRCVLDGESLDVGLAELDLPEPCAAGERGRLLELCVGHVDPDHPAAAAHLAGGEEAVHPRSAPEIDRRLAGADVGEVEVVADPGERVDRLGRDLVELR